MCIFSFIRKFLGKMKLYKRKYYLYSKERIFIRYLLLLFVSFLFLAGCGSGDTEEPAEENTEPTEGTEEDASDESVEDKEGTGSETDPETDTEGTDSEGDTSEEESTEETEDSTGEDRGTEDSDRDDEAEDEETESGNEDGTEEDDSSDSSSSITDSASADSAESASRDINFDVAEEALTGLDGTEMTSMFEMNSGLGEQLSNAEESDAAPEEVLVPKEDISTYYAETFMVIHVFTGDSEAPADSDMAGLTAEIDESDAFEVFSGMFDPVQSAVVPYAYANTDSLFVYENGMWNDYTGQAEAEEIYYGSYSNLYDAFMESADVVNVSEDDENYYLHNIGSEDVLHDTFGTLFSVEFTNADLEQQQNGVIGVVDKETNELSQVAYVSTAPGIVEGERLHIEVSSKLDEYGEYDDSGITVPEGIYD